MTSIDLILNSLEKSSHDKSTLLISVYQENSLWLRNEFELIRKLIVQSSGDLSLDSAAVTPKQQSTVTTNYNEEDQANRKRKSREIVNGEVKQSPEQKRSSIDPTILIIQAGLPSDLNSLTKEKLLSKLEQKGVYTFTMKSLKKELIEGLKHTLIEEHRLHCKSENEIQRSQNEANHNTETISSQTRKSSLMSQFRSSLASAPVIYDSNSDAAAAAAASEFQARLNRRRDSQTATSNNMSCQPDQDSENVEKNYECLKSNKANNQREDLFPAKMEIASPNRCANSADMNEIAVDVLITAEISVLPKDVDCTVEVHKLSPIVNNHVIEPIVATVTSTVSQTITCIENGHDLTCSAPVASDVSSTHIDSYSNNKDDPKNDISNVPTKPDQVAAADVPIVLSDSIISNNTCNNNDAKIANNDKPSTVIVPLKNTTVQPSSSGVTSKVSKTVKTAEDLRSQTKKKELEGNKTTVTTSTSSSSAANAKPKQQIASSAVPISSYHHPSPGTISTSKTSNITTTAGVNSSQSHSTTTVATKKGGTTHGGGVGGIFGLFSGKKVPSVTTNASSSSLVGSNLATNSSKINNLSVAALQPPPLQTAANNNNNSIVFSNSNTEVLVPPPPRIPASSSSTATTSSLSTVSAGASAISNAIFGNNSSPTFSGKKVFASSNAATTSSSASLSKVDAAALPILESINGKSAELQQQQQSSSAKEVKLSPFVSNTTDHVAATTANISSVSSSFVNKSMISSIVSNYNNACKGTTHNSNNNTTVAVVTTSSVPQVPLPFSSAATSAVVSLNKQQQSSVPSQLLSQSSLLSAPVLRDITPSGTVASLSITTAPPVSSSSATNATVVTTTTPMKKIGVVTPAATPVETEYVIEDRPDSDEEDDEDDSGTDNDESEEKKKEALQSVPEWARGAKLKEALERQYGLIPGIAPLDPDTIFPDVPTCNLEEIFGRREGKTRKYSHRSSSAHWHEDELTPVEKRNYRKHMGYDKYTH